MKKIVLLTLVSVLLSLSMFGAPFVATVGGSTIYHVYPEESIQEAINSAQSGDTIIVHNGTYYEHVVVNKSLSLVGEGREVTFIDGNGTGIVVTIEADAVVINNFTVRNGGLDFMSGGIVLYNARGCVIEGNVVANNFAGIYLSVSNNNTIKQNVVTYNEWGIHLLDSNNNTVKENTVANNYEGFLFVYSGSNVLKNNNMTSNVYNFNVYGDKLSHFVIDVDYSNTVDGKTVYYFINEKGLTISPTTFPNVGYLAIVNSTCITVQNLNLTNNGAGMLFAYTNNSKIKNVNLTNNWIGFLLIASNGNIFSRNRAAENAARCIELSDSNNNTFVENVIANNGDGLELSSSDNNTFIRNTVTNSYRGIYLSGSSNNVIYHNSFINNTNQVIVQSGAFITPNTWDDGYPSGGNYWSDYNGTDGYHPHDNATGPPPDGIGDTPYTIDANNTDSYPLMGMFSDFNATSEYHVQTVCNSTISDFQFNGTAISFNVSGENDTTGLCRILIPTALMNGTYKVFVNYTEVQYIKLGWSNSTHSYLYFTYNHSTQEVVIIPEFPTLTSMLLALAMLTVAIAIYKRRPLKTSTH
jgi:parallel beta-helix repeat protein